MIPNNNYQDEMEDVLIKDFEVGILPSFSYRLNMEKNTIIGKLDELEAVKQAVCKILNTERYESLIYSWDYGVELQDLIGQGMDLAITEVGDRITDALLQDDRIEAVTDVEMEVLGKSRLHVTFTVVCVFGEFKSEMKVKI